MDSNQDVISQAAKEILILNAEIAELTERRDLLKSHFKNAEQYPPGKYDLGETELVVSTNSRISQTKAERVLSDEDLNIVSTRKVDAKGARAYLPKDMLDAIMDHYDNKIEVRPRG